MNVAAHLEAHRYAELLAATEDARDLESVVARAHACCFLQREEDAAELVADLPFEGEAAAVHAILAAYFASRAAMVRKLGIDDPPGARLAARYKRHPAFKPKIRLSAVLIVKNEARHIERCLRSVAPVVDEVVIVDTGSSDDTMKRAKRVGLDLKIGQFAWSDDFAAARNAALDLAGGHWALWIDADEELCLEGHGDVRQALIRPHFGGFYLGLTNLTGEEGDDSAYHHTAMRLFQRLPDVRWQGRIHEQVFGIVERYRLPVGSLKDGRLLHYGYRPSEMTAKNKHERFLTMLEREVREHPTDGFQWFNLANAYTVADRLSEAEHAARNALRYVPDDANYVALIFQLLANSLTQTGRPQLALELLAEAETRGFRGLFTEFETANALMLAGSPEPALEAVDRAMACDWPAGTMGDATLFTFKRHLLRGQILALLGRLDESLEMFDYALSVNPDFGNSLFLKAATLASAGRHTEAVPLFEAASATPELRAIALAGLGRSRTALGQYAAAAAAFEQAWQAAPTNYEAWAEWAEACEASNDLETVVRAYGAFAQNNQVSPEILVNWGRALDRAGQSQRALECFSEALRRAPDDPNPYFNCGDLLFRHGRFQDAAHLYEGGLRLKADFAPGWFVLGNSLAQLGLVDGAALAYREALKLDPEHADAAANLAVVTAPAEAA